MSFCTLGFPSGLTLGVTLEQEIAFVGGIGFDLPSGECQRPCHIAIPFSPCFLTGFTSNASFAQI